MLWQNAGHRTSGTGRDVARGTVQHFRILESWRLSAALAVMVYHFLRYAPGDQRPASEVLERFLPLMDMFFMISGFLIMMRYADTLLEGRRAIGRFFVRRLMRIYPLYLFTLAFFAAVGLAAQAGLFEPRWHGRYDFAVFWQHVLLVQGWGLSEGLAFNYVGWTLSAEWFCYLLFPLIVLVYRVGGAAGLLVLLAAVVAGLELAVAGGLIPFEHWMLADTWGAYRAFADFVIGALVAVAVRHQPQRAASHLPAWVAFLAALVAMYTEREPYLVLALLTGALYLAAAAEHANPAGARFLTPLHPVGRVSFGIYLLHPVVETVLLAGLWGLVLERTGLVPFFVYWYLPMAAAIAAAMLSERFFETPVARRIAARTGGASRPAAAVQAGGAG